MNRPNSRANLDKALQRIAEGDRDGYIRVRAVVANTVVGQMLPSGAVKGGTAIKLRLGDRITRFTTDLDVARAIALDDFVDALDVALAEGWSGFTGRVVPRRPAKPKDVPPQYVMQPYEVIAYRKKQPWPSPIIAEGGWEEAYDEQRKGLPVLEDIGEAVEWANDLIERIADA